MCLALFVFALFVSWSSFVSAVPVVCVPWVPLPNEPPNANGVQPIICTVVATKTNITCYPQQEVIMWPPGPILQRIMCEPVVVPPTTTIPLTTTEYCPEDEEPTTTRPPLRCVPKDKFLGGVPNAQNISAIRCTLQDNTIIACYPPTELTFPRPFPEYINCDPMPPTPIVCVPKEAIPGAPMNSDGIYPIVCLTIQDKIPIQCFPSYLVTFPQQFPTRVMCLTPYL